MNDDVERALRASLAENAKHAPSGDVLAERIIAEADHLRPVGDLRAPRPRRWRSWTLPLIASGAVAAMVAAVVVAAQLRHPSAHPAGPPASSLTTSAPVSSTAPTSAPTSAPSTTTAPSSPPSVTQQAPPVTPVPGRFEVADLTFVSPHQGWALGSGDCFKDRSQRCIAVARTSDGGQTWTSVLNPPANISVGGSCVAPCVEHIRFATPEIGYAYGADALFLTTDGGADWSQQAGGATSLEVENGTALRVTGGRLLIAATGTDGWQPASLPGGAVVDGPVYRAAHSAFVLAGDGSAGQARAILSSGDDGRTWVKRANPCAGPQAKGPPHVAVGADGALVLMCVDDIVSPTSHVAPSFRVTVSTDGGATFTPARFTAPSPKLRAFAAADAATLFFCADALYRSTNGGQSWQRVASDASTESGAVAFVGFENPATGRWVTGDGSSVWTTTDGGSSWTQHAFR
jgi:photosystem II stability/assembly factor-like uncharacterized protein